jgi:hypothetical protein
MSRLKHLISDHVMALSLLLVLLHVLSYGAITTVAGPSFKIDYANDTFLKDGLPFR